MTSGTIPQYPVILTATQRNIGILRNRPCWKALHGATFVLREEFSSNDYATQCQCLQHECENNFQILQDFHKRAITRKNLQLINGDKLIGQKETSSQQSVF